MKICIGVATSGRGVRPRTVESLLGIVNEAKCDFHFEMASEGYTIAENRNYLAAKAIKNNCTHLLFIDDDMMFPVDTLTRLLAHNKEIIGVNYHPRMLCTLYMVGLFGDEEDGGEKVKEEDLPKELFTCRGVGAGVLLIDTCVFHKIERPWFAWEVHEYGMVTEGEDFYFCKKAREAGYEIWCDPTLKINHLGEYAY